MLCVARNLTLTAATRRAFDRLAADSARVFGDRFVALVAYDPERAVVFSRSVSSGDLAALAPLAEVWHREGLRTPLVMTREEFLRSLDAFPLEYQAIIDRHVVIAGTDPFPGLAINPEDLRRACELQAKAHLIHLRQGWLEAGGHSHELADLVRESATPWRVLLENVARLRGVPHDDDSALAAFAGSVTGMAPDLVQALIAAGHGASDPARLVARLPDYLAGAEQLWATIDTWRA
jgi:hypothetical protein